jgi:hypothetical protein
MAWESRKDSGNQYYYRSKRLPDGRIVKTYCGTGITAAAAAEADRAERLKREQEVQYQRGLIADVEPVGKMLDAFCDSCTIVTAATLLAAGYHNHKSEWRKRRHGRHPDTQ